MLSDGPRVSALQVFEELGNLLKMENGSAPVARAAEWEDERVVVGYVLSPLHAGGLLFPGQSGAAAGERPRYADRLVGHLQQQMAKKWLVERIITPESHQIILDQLLDKSRAPTDKRHRAAGDQSLMA